MQSYWELSSYANACRLRGLCQKLIPYAFAYEERFLVHHAAQGCPKPFFLPVLNKIGFIINLFFYVGYDLVPASKLVNKAKILSILAYEKLPGSKLFHILSKDSCCQ